MANNLKTSPLRVEQGKSMYTVAAMLYPDALATSVTLPMEILHAASQMASVRKRGLQQVRFLLASTDRKAVTLATGIVLKPDITIDNLPDIDLFILPAIWRNPVSTIQHSRPWLPLLNATAATGSLICSVGTASTLLAEAGLLDERPATTHWNYFDRFAQRYPGVNLKTRHLITQSDNIYCVGSVNSIADLMVHIVEGWFGSKISRSVESQFSPEIRQSFWSASYQNLPDSSHHDELILEAQQWLQEHLGTSVRMQVLADALQISVRSLNRRFKQATGFTPNDYLQSLRVNMAKDLLRHSNLPVSDIAWQVGLQDVSYFSQLFKRVCGVTPLRYREAVRGKLFAVDDTSGNLRMPHEYG